jgi:regulator of nonsense transcripts 2
LFASTILTTIQANDDIQSSAQGSDSEEEAIVVTRPEEEVDLEAEADFDREYAKMMAESLESRKFERKPLFDVPLPMRRKERDATAPLEPGEETAATSIPSIPAPTMAFSLLTKRGNRQQVSKICTWIIALANRLHRLTRSIFHQIPTSLSR